MNRLDEKKEQFARSIGATHKLNGKFVKAGDGTCAMVYTGGTWEYDTDLSDPERYPACWRDCKIYFSKDQSTQGEVYGNKTNQQDAILDALKELTAAYRRLGGLDCAYDKELLVAEALLNKLDVM